MFVGADLSIIDKKGAAFPVRARSFWPNDLHTRLLPDQLGRTLYIQVGKDGMTQKIFEDDECKTPITDTEIAALTPELHFMPALEKGKAVEGVAQLTLGRFN